MLYLISHAFKSAGNVCMDGGNAHRSTLRVFHYSYCQKCRDCVLRRAHHVIVASLTDREE